MKKRTKLQFSKGMTLVELLVVLAIFAIVAGLTIFDYGQFRSSTSMQNLADDIALSIRKAQSYAIGTHVSGSSFSNGYGVHFTTSDRRLSPLSGSSKSFILFTDIASGISPANKSYDYQPDSRDECGVNISMGNECTEQLNIVSADKIMAIYLNDEDTPINPDTMLDITFLRPNPDAYFCYIASLDPTAPCARTTDISHVKIIVADATTPVNAQTRAKAIVVWNTGQISIEDYARPSTTGVIQGPGRTGGETIDIGGGDTGLIDLTGAGTGGGTLQGSTTGTLQGNTTGELEGIN